MPGVVLGGGLEVLRAVEIRVAEDHRARGEEIAAEAATQAAHSARQHVDGWQVLALLDAGSSEEGDLGHKVEEQAEGDTFGLTVVFLAGPCPGNCRQRC